MPEVQWIKLYIDMFDKRKIGKIRRLPDGDRILLFWVMLLATAGKCNAGGMIFITERIPFTKEDLADEFDIEISTIEFALKAFVELDMIDLSEEGFIHVVNWEKYQNEDKFAEIREKNRERKRLERERKKQALLGDVSRDGHVTVTPDVTPCHAIEEEEEGDSEKEFHSFVHSIAREETQYVEDKVAESGLVGEDAAAYREEVKDRLKREYLKGPLGHGTVFMSMEQFDSLLGMYSLDEIERYFSIIDECERSGKRFKKKTHYQAVIDMATEDRRI